MGVGAAVFNAAQQVGSAVNVAIVTTILVETTKTDPQTPKESYHGVSSAIWWIVAIGCAEAIASAIFFRPRKNSLEGDGGEGMETQKLQARDDEVKEAVATGSAGGI